VNSTIPPKNRADRARATRQHLITTTIDVVRTRSYGAATLFEVAKAAGVTPGALQHHFGSRAELMMEVLQTILESSDDASPPWPDSNVPLAQRAQHYVQALWSRVYEPPRFLAAWSVYFGAAGEDALKPRIVDMRKQLSRSLRQRFVQVFPESQGRPGLQAFVDLLLSSLRGMGVARLFGADPVAESAQRKQLAAVIANWCAPPVAATSPLPEASRHPARRTPPPRRKDTP
jgi:AcrR family transcriptional regulator